MENLQKIANCITAGIITTGLIIGAAMMLRINTSIKSDRKVAPKEDRGPKCPFGTGASKARRRAWFPRWGFSPPARG